MDTAAWLPRRQHPASRCRNGTIIYWLCGEQTGYIDYDKLEEKALDFRPKMLICGGSAYPREWDYKRLYEIAQKVGALLMSDMAHIRCAARAAPYTPAQTTLRLHSTPPQALCCPMCWNTRPLMRCRCIAQRALRVKLLPMVALSATTV